MQMIVHGFPSRLVGIIPHLSIHSSDVVKKAALQFEWAWQHPHISRHLRDHSGKALFSGDRKSRYLKMNIWFVTGLHYAWSVMLIQSVFAYRTVRIMISNHPYSTWPLHVKLFTKEAVACWTNATKDDNSFPLPPGFTCSIELEGVDGKSGHLGSGRTGPINVKDGSNLPVDVCSHLTNRS